MGEGEVKQGDYWDENGGGNMYSVRRYVWLEAEKLEDSSLIISSAVVFNVGLALLYPDPHVVSRKLMVGDLAILSIKL